MENEHSSYSAKGGTSGGSVAADFVHKEGSARGYYASGAPTVRPDGSTALGAGDDGRIWVDSDTNELYVWSGSAWVAAGRTPPVGTIYFQLAGKTAPGTLWGGTWTDVSSTYAGCFFRAAGGNANTFASGNQAANLSAHTHTGPSHTHAISITSDNPSTQMKHQHSVDLFSATGGTSGRIIATSVNTGGGVTTTVTALSAGTGTELVHTHAVSGTSGAEGTGATGSAGSGTDLRPLNQTIKVWERTA